MLCSERRFVPIVSVASGVALSGLYSTRGFTEAAGMAAGEMFTWALVGNVVGIFVLGPLGDYLPARVRAVASLLSVAAAHALFAVVSGPAGFTAAAFVLGLASSLWIKLFNQADEWLDESNGVRRARGERVAWPTVGLTMLSFGLAASTATVLAAHGVLIGFGLDVTVLVTAAMAVVLAVGLWVTHPPGRPAFSWRDRGSWAELVRSVFVEPARALRNPFFVAVAAVYGFSAMMLGSFDELWPHALGHAHAPAWLAVVLNYGLIAGDLLLLAVAWLGDLVSRRSGEQRDFLVERARTFTLGMAALMFFGAASVTLTQHVFGVPAVGIGINAFAGEAGSVGMILAVNALLKQHIADRREREHANNMAQQLKALSMLVPGAALAGSTWAGATPGLPSGWAGVSVQIGVAGAAMHVAALAVILWRHRGGNAGDGPASEPRELHALTERKGAIVTHS